tara:strand:+ start:642 stop:1658 length:1017 start_codon:yes stop_codon:yes gene_type:complete
MARQKLSKTLRGKSTSSLSGRSERMTPAEIRKAKAEIKRKKALAANKKAAAKAAKAKKPKKPTSVRFAKNYKVEEGASGDPVTNRSAKIARQVGTRGEKVTTNKPENMLSSVSKGEKTRGKLIAALEAKVRNNTATPAEIKTLNTLDKLSEEALKRRNKNISKTASEKKAQKNKPRLATLAFGEQTKTTSNKRSGNIDPETGEVTGTPTKKQEEAARKNLAARKRQKTMTTKQLESQAKREEEQDKTKKGTSKVGRRKRVVGQKGATKTAAKTAQVKRQAGGKTIPQGSEGKGIRALVASGPKGKQAAKDMGFAVAKKGGRIVAAMKGGQIVSMMYDD